MDALDEVGVAAVRIYPTLARLGDKVTSLWESVDSLVGGMEDAAYDLDVCPDPLPSMDLLAEVEQIVTNEKAVGELLGEILVNLNEALDRTGEALPDSEEPDSSLDYETLKEARALLERVYADVISFVDELYEAVLGIWGAFFLSRAYDAGDNLFENAPHGVPDDLVQVLRPVAEKVRRGKLAQSEVRRKLDERNQRIYESAMAGKPWSEIRKLVNGMLCGWSHLGSIQAVKAAACSYAKSHGLPLPERRQPGRPPGS